MRPTIPRLLRRTTMIVVLVIFGAVVMLGIAANVLDQPVLRQQDAPSVSTKEGVQLLPETTGECRNDPDRCDAVVVVGGQSIGFLHVEDALGLSSPDELMLAPAIRTPGGWQLEIPDSPGTMLVSAGEQLWLLKIT